MSDIITLQGLMAQGIHGVYDFEHLAPQPFVVDVSLWVDIASAVANDDITQTVSYADIAADVVSIVEGPSVHLIETLASCIADHIMTYPRVEGVEVRVHKPQAPMDQTFADVAVTVRRGVTTIDEAAVVRTLDADLNAIVSDEDSVADLPALVTTEVAAQERSRSGERQPAELVSVEPVADFDAQVVELPPLDAPASPEGEAGGDTQQVPARDVVLAFGGNEGNVPVTLVRALEALIDAPGIEISNVSPLLRTRAVIKPGMEPQDDHWNMVVLASSTLEAHALLQLTAGIENDLGRLRPFEWAPRTIDIDIIAIGDEVVNDEVLQIPHPRAHGRAFVLVPWLLADIDAVFPGRGRVVDLAAQAADRDGIIDIIEGWYDTPETVITQSNALLAQAMGLTEPVTPPANEAESAQPAPAEEPTLEADQRDSADDSANAEASLDTQATAQIAVSHATQTPAAKPRPAVRNFAAEWEAFEKTVDFNAKPEPEPQSVEPVLDVPEPEPVVIDDIADVEANVATSKAIDEQDDALAELLVDEDVPVQPIEDVDDNRPAAVPEVHVPSFDEALVHEEPGSTTDIPVSWRPVSQATPRVQQRDDSALPDQPTEARPAWRPLPSWDFKRNEVTIIDSLDDNEQSAASADVSVQETLAGGELRVVLDPDLPEGTDIGLLPQSTQSQAAQPSHAAADTPDEAATPASPRKHVFRPTHTGAIRAVKRSQ